MDNNTLSLFEKMNILDLGVIYTIKERRFNIATDYEACLVEIIKDKKTKNVVLTLSNPFSNNFPEGKDLCDELLLQLYNIPKEKKEEILKETSYFDKYLEDLYKFTLDKLERLDVENLIVNNHWDILQYSHIIDKYT